jgi:phytoene dehydrogenase-like protein
MYSQWQEVFDISKLTFVHPEECVRLETEHGEYLTIYTNVDRMETELLQRAPQDAAEIRHFASSVRRLANFAIPDPTEPWPRNWLTLLRTLRYLPLLRRWSSVSCKEYSEHFTHPPLKGFFGGGELAQLSAVALVFALAWMSKHAAGYAIGGSQAIIRLIADNLLSLGGHELRSMRDRGIAQATHCTAKKIAKAGTGAPT